VLEQQARSKSKSVAAKNAAVQKSGRNLNASAQTPLAAPRYYDNRIINPVRKKCKDINFFYSTLF